MKMTFKKKTPDLINLFFHSPTDDVYPPTSSNEKVNSEGGHELSNKEEACYKSTFRVSKRDLFVQTLQVS
jgi:hypothetical protein